MRIQCFKNVKSNSKAWITKIAHHNVSLRSSKDFSLETKKLLMSHCFAERRAEMPTSSVEFVVLPASSITTSARVIGTITREFHTRKFGFKVLGDNTKVFYYLYTRVAFSRLDATVVEIIWEFESSSLWLVQKNAAVGGALTGALLSFGDSPFNQDKMIRTALTASALATASELFKTMWYIDRGKENVSLKKPLKIRPLCWCLASVQAPPGNAMPELSNSDHDKGWAYRSHCNRWGW